MRIRCTNPATKHLRTPEVVAEYDSRVLDFSEGKEPDVRADVAEALIEAYPALEAVDASDDDDETDDADAVDESNDDADATDDESGGDDADDTDETEDDE